jgi:hypothetical protein
MLAMLTLEEKITLLTGADYWSLRGHPGIGLRPIGRSSRDLPITLTISVGSCDKPHPPAEASVEGERK